MGRLLIERRGGIAGIVAHGEIEEEALSAEDRELLDGLFQSGASLPPAPGADRFRYLVTREINQVVRTLEIPEHLVPRSIAGAVKETFR
jgi:hypothetical protein